METTGDRRARTRRRRDAVVFGRAHARDSDGGTDWSRLRAHRAGNTCWSRVTLARASRRG